MPLDLKQLVQVDISGDYLWQTNKTGAYDVDLNPGGFGGLNPNLNQSALVAISKRLDEVLEYVNAQIRYSNVVANDFEDQWQVVYPSKDGWIRLWMLRLPVSNDGVTDVTGQYLEDGQYFYIPGQDGKIWIKIGSGSSGTIYEELENWDDLLDSDDETNPYLIMCEDLFINKSAKFVNNLYKSKIQARSKNDDQVVSELSFKISDIKDDLQGADYAFRGGLMNQANDIIESLMDNYQIV